MSDRQQIISEFLAQNGLQTAARKSVAGDASGRRYERLSDSAGARTIVLMDAPPGSCGSVAPFCRIAGHFRDLGLSAPQILAENAQAGLLLIEDFGDASFTNIIAARPDRETRLYAAATDVLIHLRQPPPPWLPRADAGALSALIELAYTHYRGEQDSENAVRLMALFKNILQQFDQVEPVLIHRDYHADNLMWLPHRSGIARVGLLDFQDAMRGHPAYDLVSLLQDARRDVSPKTEDAMIAHYVTATGVDEHDFRAAYAVIGAQRHLRILGVFARLSLDHGKPAYVDLIPRTWAHLMRCLDHPALASVADLLRADLPAPTDETLQRLRTTCR